MIRLCWLTLGLLLVATLGHAADEGLVACYTFDEASGDIARDTSGHGLDGKIHGATRVPSPRGRALHFNGKSDYVDLGMPDGLVLKGDLTLEAWVRPEALHQRNRLMIGDTAGLTVHRNYSIRFDREGIYFECGNGREAVQVVSKHAPRLNEWAHLAMLCETPHPRVSVNPPHRAVD